jgi:aryl-alcohol dehydrogenase-like predicted oxidoreductase
VDYAYLGHTGIRVPRLCMGTMTFGGQSDQAQAHAILDRALELGICFLDTADIYPAGATVGEFGRSEEIVGAWLKGRRDDVLVATKGFGRTSHRPWDQGNSRKHLVEAVETSLRRLGTDYIDLYQLHEPDAHTPIDETLRALDDLVSAGKIRYYGCSNFLAYQLARAIGRAEVLRLTGISTVQPRYNLLHRAAERELFPLCLQERIGVLVYNPIAGGFLGGEHSRSQPPPGDSRFIQPRLATVYRDRYWQDQMFDTVEQMRQIALDLGLPVATLALSWVLANPAVTVAIVGAVRPEQLDELAAATSVSLPEDAKKALDALSEQYLGTDLRLPGHESAQWLADAAVSGEPAGAR